jgi:hypothetical protein
VRLRECAGAAEQAEPKARDWLTVLDDFRSWLIRELCKQAIFPTDSSHLRHRGLVPELGMATVDLHLGVTPELVSQFGLLFRIIE